MNATLRNPSPDFPLEEGHDLGAPSESSERGFFSSGTREGGSGGDGGGGDPTLTNGDGPSLLDNGATDDGDGGGDGGGGGFVERAGEGFKEGFSPEALGGTAAFLLVTGAAGLAADQFKRRAQGEPDVDQPRRVDADADRPRRGEVDIDGRRVRDTPDAPRQSRVKEFIKTLNPDSARLGDADAPRVRSETPRATVDTPDTPGRVRGAAGKAGRALGLVGVGLEVGSFLREAGEVGVGEAAAQRYVGKSAEEVASQSVVQTARDAGTKFVDDVKTVFSQSPVKTARDIGADVAGLARGVGDVLSFKVASRVPTPAPSPPPLHQSNQYDRPIGPEPAPRAAPKPAAPSPEPVKTQTAQERRAERLDKMFAA